MEQDNLDTVDGFMKAVSKKLKTLSCIRSSGNKEVDEDSNMQWSEPQLSTEHFQGGTALVASEEDQYNFKHQKRGLAVIINNWKFSDDVRDGSIEDAEKLKSSFEALGFDVMVLENLKSWQMLTLLEQAASKNYNHSDVDCFVCAVLSHGDRKLIDEKEWVDVILGVDSLPNEPKYIKTETILEIFSDNKCPSLIGKPRLFFVQACRGYKCDSGVDIAVTTKTVGGLNIQPKARGNVAGNAQVADATGEGATRRDEVDVGKGDEGPSVSAVLPVSPAPLYKDYMVMYATPPGYYAWRSDTGSWFITELCKALNSNVVYRKSLATFLSMVCGRVAEGYKSNTLEKINVYDTEVEKKMKQLRNIENEIIHGKVVVPVIESMLVKDIVFNRKCNFFHVA